MKISAIDVNVPTLHPLVIQTAAEIQDLVEHPSLGTGMACQDCGCDDDHACHQAGNPDAPVSCWWVAPFLCSFCAASSHFAYLMATGRAS